MGKSSTQKEVDRNGHCSSPAIWSATPRERRSAQIEKKLVEKLEEIGPQNVAEVVFTVGRSTQGLYLRIEFLQPNSQISDSSKVETTKTREIGVSCVGEYAEVDLIPITLEISFKAQGDKCDASVQTGTPLQF
ncbi:hypothetical protein RB195_015026 [Necator americanus]|uniref:Uncharacterized protein n=1 Tax=Necator americanus TaxID=51031 RepID=A0ABR1E373_NECAM